MKVGFFDSWKSGYYGSLPYMITIFEHASKVLNEVCKISGN